MGGQFKHNGSQWLCFMRGRRVFVDPELLREVVYFPKLLGIHTSLGHEEFEPLSSKSTTNLSILIRLFFLFVMFGGFVVVVS